MLSSFHSDLLGEVLFSHELFPSFEPGANRQTAGFISLPVGAGGDAITNHIESFSRRPMVGTQYFVLIDGADNLLIDADVLVIAESDGDILIGFPLPANDSVDALFQPRHVLVDFLDAVCLFRIDRIGNHREKPRLEVSIEYPGIGGTNPHQYLIWMTFARATR